MADAIPSPPEPTGAARYVRADVLERLATPPTPPPPKRRSGAAKAAHAIWMVYLIGLVSWGVVKWLDSVAPHAYSRPVPAAQVSSFDSACSGYGWATSAVATGDSGGLTLFTVVCSNRGYPIDAQVAR